MTTRPEIIAEVRRWVEKAENDFRKSGMPHLSSTILRLTSSQDEPSSGEA